MVFKSDLLKYQKVKKTRFTKSFNYCWEMFKLNYYILFLYFMKEGGKIMEKRILIIGLVFLLLFLSVVPIPIGNELKISDIKEQSSIRGNTLYVGGTGPHNYTKIQDAIDNVSDGDTVFVYTGIYYENITVDKSIDLIGEDKQSTIINGKNNKVPVLIFSSYTLLSNFCIKKSKQSGFGQGIYIGDIDEGKWFENITISNCIITQNGKGIFAKNISNITIKNCDIYENLASSINFNFASKNIHIFNCTIRNNGIETSSTDKQTNFDKIGGIFFQTYSMGEIENVTINHSCIYDNIGVGILIMGGDFYNLHNNTIYNNSWYGIDLTSTKNVYIRRNNLTKNHNVGIHANLIKNGIISDNFIHGNGINLSWIESSYAGGIYLGYNSRDVLIMNNNISFNSCYGIMILSSSFFNITQNRFINNNISEIDIRGCEYVEVNDNILNDYRFGIRLLNNSNKKTYFCKILNNYFLSLDFYLGPYEHFIGSTIYLSESNYNIINDNTIIHTQIIDNYKSGIICENSNENTFYKNFIKDCRFGLKAEKSMNNVIKQNSFIHNAEDGIYFSKSSNNLIQSNNFINNSNQALFENVLLNKWKANYWNESRVLPYFIFGRLVFIPWFNIDWHPAKEPYDI
jgi:parallel beta-helix repeat protein